MTKLIEHTEPSDVPHHQRESMFSNEFSIIFAEFDLLMQQLASWRLQLLPLPNKQIETSNQDHLVINQPHFDTFNSDDNDFFMLQGYLNPGANHWMIVYDPVLKKFFKKTKIVVQSQVQEFSLPCQKFELAFEEETQRAITKKLLSMPQVLDHNLLHDARSLFPFVWHDLTQQNCSLMCHCDLQQIKACLVPFDLEEMRQDLISIYPTIMKVYKLLTFRHQAPDDGQLVQFLMSVVIGKSYDQVEVAIGSAKDMCGSRTITPRAKLALILITLASDEGDQTAPDLGDLERLLQSFLFEAGSAETLSQNQAYLRELVVLQNRPLITLLKHHQGLLRKLYDVCLALDKSNKFSVPDADSIVTTTLPLLNKFVEEYFPEHDKLKQSFLYKVAREAKAEQIHPGQNSGDFQYDEFLVFLVTCLVVIWSDSDEDDEDFYLNKTYSIISDFCYWRFADKF
jgi:hypothetical protein